MSIMSSVTLVNGGMKDKYTYTNQVSMKVHNQAMENHSHVLFEDTRLAFIINFKNLLMPINLYFEKGGGVALF